MAVAARVPEVLARVEPYRQDLSKKSHIILGNEYEELLFAELERNLPAGEFFEFVRENQSVEASLEAMRRGVPVIAQAMFSHTFGDFEWLGYADLLVREDYELLVAEDGSLTAAKSSGEISPKPRPKYVVWDVKSSKKESPKYWKQIAGYAEFLQLHGLASEQPVGVVLAGREFVRADVTEGIRAMRQSRDLLFNLLRQTNPDTITAAFSPMDCCAERHICEDLYCNYPDLCAKIRYDRDTLEQLPSGLPQHRAALAAAGVFTTRELAVWPSDRPVSDLDDKLLQKYIRWSQVIQKEREAGPYFEKLANPAQVGLPAASSGDLYFDIEWFNPLEQEELIFMFGVVDADSKFTAFLAHNAQEERQAFEQFVALAIAKLNDDPYAHIYHYDSPEPNRLRKLAVRYQTCQAEVRRIVESMIDLKVVAKASIMPGCAGYSIKQLERYYQAGSLLNRGGLVKGGDDAMYQYNLYRQQIAQGEDVLAAQTLQIILDYNRDDCLSTKLLAEWLDSLNTNEG